MDMGGHTIDLLEMFFGDVTKVSCAINSTVHKYKAEDSATAILTFASGALATVDTFFCIPDVASLNVLELYGSKGSILAKGTIGQGVAGEMTAYLEKGDAGYSAKQARSKAGGMPMTPKPVNTYKAEIEEFSQAILGRREPVNNAQIGLHSQKVLDACYRSARTGKAVKV